MVFVNRAKFEALPDDLQLAVALAAKALAGEIAGEAALRNRDRLGALKGTQVNVRALPKDIASGLMRAHEDALREAATRSNELADALRERQALLSRSADWARTEH
jgi:TRAP-type mannitol/chloroaromatic compound transport system substrate-binding protein